MKTPKKVTLFWQGIPQLFNALESEAVYTPKWEYDRIFPLELINYEKLCSRA